MNDGDIIFATNDPAIIESHHLRVSTKRKPDLVCLLATNFISIIDDVGPGFKACMSKAKAKRSSTHITWGDVLQSWELEANGKITSKIRKNFKSQDFLDSGEEESSTDEPAGASTSQSKCAYVPWSWLMLFLFQLLRSLVSSGKEVQRLTLQRRNLKSTRYFNRSSQNLQRSFSARTTG